MRDRKRTQLGFSGCVWGEAFFAFSCGIGLVTLIITLLTNLHAHATLRQAFGRALADAAMGFCITLILTATSFFGAIYISNLRERKK